MLSTWACTRAVTNPSWARRRISLIVSNSVIVRFCGLRLGYANDPAGKTTTGVPGRLGFQIIGFFVDDDCMTNYRISAGKFHYLVTPFEMSLARRVRFNVA